MGLQFPLRNQEGNYFNNYNMKAFVATVAMAAAASASPAADPALLYTAGGAVVPAAGYPVVSPLTYATAPLAHTIPVAHTTYTVPEVSVPTVGLKDTGLVVHPESGAITPEFTAAQVKAAPELDANTVAIQKLAVTGSKVVQKAATYTVPHVATHVAPVVALGKREAEAEAKPEAEAEAEAKPGFFYSSGVVHPGAYHGVYPAVHPAVYSGVVPAVAPVVTSTTGLVAHPNGAVTPDLTPAQKVATLNHYAAKGVVPLVHYGKREAEADAEADAWGYGYAPAVYGYGSRFYGYPYGGYGYHYGKRSAEAEPTADAEADAYYGYTGYTGVYRPAVYGYGSRVYGYGYPFAGYGYHYGKRSADAEPKAEAEADAYYGYTGYTGVYHPAVYGYGSRVYGYGHGYPYGAGYAYYG